MALHGEPDKITQWPRRTTTFLEQGSTRCLSDSQIRSMFANYIERFGL